MAVTVIGITRDGKRHTDPSEIKICEKDYPEFYRIVMAYEPEKKDDENGTA